jgi:molybdopterin-biosynthesis enzyme MoeA-like protein
MTGNKSPKIRRKSHNDEVDQAASLRSSKPVQVAIGFRVKSGRAIAVVLAGPPDSPQVLARREIKLCDPDVPDSIQPYHAALEMPGPKATKAIERLVKIVRRATSASVGELIMEWRGAGHQIRGGALVVGSLIDPGTIKNDHIRAHALEGQLFRVSVQEALQSNGLSGAAIPERDVYSMAAAALARSEDELKRAVLEFGRAVGGPWRADEKTAAVAAWMAFL